MPIFFSGDPLKKIVHIAHILPHTHTASYTHCLIHILPQHIKPNQTFQYIKSTIVQERKSANKMAIKISQAAEAYKYLNFLTTLLLL